MSNEGRLFVMSAPAGCGKTTLIERLVQEVPGVVQSISYTTRAPRTGEIDGVHYYFITRKLFEEMIHHGDFLEYVTLYGDYYGTSKSWVEKKLVEGLDIFLVIDTQGALKLRELKLQRNIKPTFIFILPPSIEVLRERLEHRKTESPEKINDRLRVAVEEMSKKDLYDYQIVNDNLEEALQKLKNILLIRSST